MRYLRRLLPYVRRHRARIAGGLLCLVSSEQVPELGDKASLIAGGVGAVLGKQALVALNAMSALFGRLVGRDVQ